MKRGTVKRLISILGGAFALLLSLEGVGHT